MTGRVEGKVAIVTGAALGQGAAHSELLAREGAHVLLGDILDQEGFATAKRIREAGGDVLYVHLDVSNKDDWTNAVKTANDKWGPVTVLVNNAGIGGAGSIVDCTLEVWHRVFETNQTGIFLGMQAVIPGMIEVGKGSIINTASQWGRTGGTEDGAVAYVTSKAAVSGLSRNAALCYGPMGIRANTLSPGMCDTRMLGKPERIELELSRAPLRRVGQPMEIAYGVLFLASDESSYVTGTDLVMDGGLEAV
jgi:3alpha(or 20beta)-hydroxysteroid dehydrogenase